MLVLFMPLLTGPVPDDPLLRYAASLYVLFIALSWWLGARSWRERTTLPPDRLRVVRWWQNGLAVYFIFLFDTRNRLAPRGGGRTADETHSAGSSGVGSAFLPRGLDVVGRLTDVRLDAAADEPMPH
jgi:hypothetical protein